VATSALIEILNGPDWIMAPSFFWLIELFSNSILGGVLDSDINNSSLSWMGAKSFALSSLTRTAGS
jgi:hypothetical protein